MSQLTVSVRTCVCVSYPWPQTCAETRAVSMSPLSPHQLSIEPSVEPKLPWQAALQSWSFSLFAMPLPHFLVNSSCMENGAVSMLNRARRQRHLMLLQEAPRWSAEELGRRGWTESVSVISQTNKKQTCKQNSSKSANIPAVSSLPKHHWKMMCRWKHVLCTQSSMSNEFGHSGSYNHNKKLDFWWGFFSFNTSRRK